MSTLTATQLQQQYIAYFGRPGDPAGIKYWLSSSSGITTAREFADKIYAQDEYKKTTVASKTTEEQVNSLYVNLFGRQADSAGLLYWTGEIQNGNLQLSNIAVNLIAAASSPIAGNETQGAADAQALANKVAAAESFTAELEKSTAAILAYQAESLTPWVSGDAFASAVSFVKTATSTNAPTASDAASAVTTMIAASTASDVPDAKSLKLTANTDALVGDGGNDTISAVLQDAGATGTTVAPGDSVDGKGGTDTFTISVAGNVGNSDYKVSALTLDNVEKLFLSNFDTNSTSGQETVVDTGLMTGLTTIGLSSSSATGDTKFNGLKNNVDVEMRNGAGDLTLDYDGTYKVTGTADVQKLTVSSLTGGDFVANKIETFNINSELVKSTLNKAASDTLKTVNVTGDQDLTITTALAFAGTDDGTTIEGTLDASAFTGKLTAGLGSASTVSVKGGTGDDTFKFAGTLTKNDVVTGGAGTDTLTMTAVTAGGLDKQFTNVSDIETVAFDAYASAAEMDVSKLSTGVTTVQLDPKDANSAASTLTVSTVKNLGSQTVVLKKTADDESDGDNNDGVEVQITGATDTSADTVNVTLDAIGLWKGADRGINKIDVKNYETVNISNKKSTSVAGNEVNAINASSATSVVVTGDANLTLDQAGITGGAMTSFDASALVGTLGVKFASDDKITAKAATKNTTFAFGTGLDQNDTVVGGAGTKDVVTATFTDRTTTTGKLNISDVETLTLNTTGGANKIDLSSVTGLKNLELDDNVQTITGFDLGTKIVSTDNDTSVKLTAADATGTADTLTFSTLLTGASSDTIEAKNIENLAITVKDTNSGIVTATYDLTKFEGTSITATQDTDATVNSNLQLGTLHKNVTSVDTSAMKDAQAFKLTNATAATTIKLSGSDAATVDGSAKADTITVGKTAGVTHVIDGKAGTDTLSITVNTGFVNPTSITNIESITLDVVAGNVDIDVSSNDFDTAATALTVTGGNTLSSFTANVLAGVKTFDASAFGGDLALSVATDNFDDTLTMTGGVSTKDAVTNTIATSTTDKPKTTGIETLKITGSDGATSAVTPTLDLSNTTGVKTVEAIVGDTDTLTIDKATTEAVKVVQMDASDSVLAYKLADATGSSDAVTFELKGSAATKIKDDAQLKTDDIETVTVKASSAEQISLANLAMTATGATMKLVVTGDKALTVSALGADVTTIDASGMDEGGSFVQTGRSATVASTYTGSDGNDTFQMKNGDDVISAGAGTNDNLVVTKNLILGGIKVDLSKTDDQITTFNGNSNSAAQTGFESVDLSGITGSFGAEITGVKGGTIIGTSNIDVITLGSGSTISLTNLAHGTTHKQDDITGFKTGSDKIGLDKDNTTDDTAAGAAAEFDLRANVTEITDNSSNYDLTNDGSAAQETNVHDIYILRGGNESQADLSAATNGSELLKYLHANGGTAGGLEVTADGNDVYVAAEDAGNTYIYHVNDSSDSNTTATASEISLIATISGTGFAGADFTMVS